MREAAVVSVLVLGGRVQAAALTGQAGVALRQHIATKADRSKGPDHTGAATGFCDRVTGHENIVLASLPKGKFQTLVSCISQSYKLTLSKITYIFKAIKVINNLDQFWLHCNME